MSDSRRIINLYKTISHEYASDPSKKLILWSSFLYKDDQQFVDYNTRSAMPSELWQPGQPNGGSAQQCTLLQILDMESGNMLFDVPCSMFDAPFCLCISEMTPVLRLRGLCGENNIDFHYTPRYFNGGIAYFGTKGIVIQYQQVDDQPKWTLSVNLKRAV